MEAVPAAGRSLGAKCWQLMGAVEDEFGPKASEKEPSQKAAPTRAGEACPVLPGSWF